MKPDFLKRQWLFVLTREYISCVRRRSSRHHTHSKRMVSKRKIKPPPPHHHHKSNASRAAKFTLKKIRGEFGPFCSALFFRTDKPVEVSDEVYAAYMKGDRKIRYFEADLKTERAIVGQDGRIEKTIPSREDSLGRLIADNAVQFPDCAEAVEELVLRRMTTKALHKALGLLAEDEHNLITALFFENKTEREYAEQLGVYHNAVHKRKIRILEKLKKLLK